jgi:hypothetical protein
MIPQLTPIERCREIAGLHPHEIMLGVSPNEAHERMLAQYRRARSSGAARAKIVADIRLAVGKGANRRAADLLIVLRRLMARDPGGWRGASASPCCRRSIAAPRRRQDRALRSADAKGGASGENRGRVIFLSTSGAPE